MRRRAKADANQPEIVSAFRRCGFMVAHTHTVGGGFPDVVVARHGRNVLIEIKDGKKSPSARKLTADENAFHQQWPGDLRVVESVDDVLKLSDELIRSDVAQVKPKEG